MRNLEIDCPVEIQEEVETELQVLQRQLPVFQRELINIRSFHLIVLTRKVYSITINGCRYQGSQVVSIFSDSDSDSTSSKFFYSNSHSDSTSLRFYDSNSDSTSLRFYDSNSDSTSLRFYDSNSDSTSLRFYDSNSDSRKPTKTTPTPESSTSKKTTPTPTSQPVLDHLRRVIFGHTLSPLDLWSRPWGVARLLGLRGVDPRPHPRNGSGKSTTTTTSQS